MFFSTVGGLRFFRPDYIKELEMKKFVIAAALTLGLCGTAYSAEELPIVGEYTNEAGYIVIAPAAKGQHANYDVGMVDKTGKCNIQLVCATNSVTGNTATGQTLNAKALVAVESQTYPNFSVWPEDQTIRLANDALPWDKLDPACKVFQENNVFTRK